MLGELEELVMEGDERLYRAQRYSVYSVRSTFKGNLFLGVESLLLYHMERSYRGDLLFQ